MRLSPLSTRWRKLTSRAEDDIAREKALQTVVAGQQAENLLDFDDEPTPTSGALPTSSAAGTSANEAISTAAKSVNPLDELMDLFSNASMSAPTGPPAGVSQLTAGGGTVSASLGGGLDDLLSPQSTGLSAPTSLPQASSPAPAQPAQPQPQAQGASGGNDDLLGLF